MSSRLHARLAEAIANKQFYEAQQLYRTLNFRLAARGQFDEAASLLYAGATILLGERLQEGGGDLACQMVLTQAKDSEPPGPLFVQRVSALCRLMKPGTAERETLTTKSLELLKSHADSKQQLHREFGFNYWLERNYSLSQYHFVRSSDSGYHCGRMLVEYSQLGYKSEIDLFLALTVLQLLCLRKLAPASLCFYTYTRRHPGLAGAPAPPFPSAFPLLNFTWLLLVSVRAGWPLARFHHLCEAYSPALGRDPTCADYLTRIGQLFFGLPAKQADTGGGFLGSLMRMLAADDGEEDAGGQEALAALRADDDMD